MAVNKRTRICGAFSMVSSRSLGLSELVRSRQVRSLEEAPRSKQVRCEKEAPGTGTRMGKLLDSSRWEVELPSMRRQQSWHQPRRLRQYQPMLR